MKKDAYVPSKWGCQKLPYEKIARMETVTNWRISYTSLIAKAIPKSSEKIKEMQKDTSQSPNIEKKPQNQTKRKRKEDIDNTTLR